MKMNLLALVVIGLLLAPFTQALAAGTAVNTDVSNQASVSYSVNSVAQTAVLSDDTAVGGTADATTFKVDRKVDLTVAFLGNQNVTPGQTNAAMLYSVTNNSNDTLDFGLTAVDILGDGFAGAVPPISSTLNGVYVDAGTLGTYDGSDTATYIDELAPDATVNVWVVVDVPATATDTLTDTWAVRAQAKAGGLAATEGIVLTTDGANTIAAVETVLADGTGSDDAAADGIHSANSNFVVQTATLTVSKSVAVYNDGTIDTPQETFAIPGAIMEYSITISNAAGAQTATGVTLIDQIPANTELNTTVSPTGGASYDYSNDYAPGPPVTATWGAAASTSAKAIKITTVDIAASNSVTVKFYVTIK